MTKSGFDNEGDLKIWWVPQIPMDAFEVAVPDLRTAAILLNTLADYDQFQFEHNVKPDYANMGGLQVFEDDDWSDWWSEDGEDFNDVRRDPELLAAEIAKEQAS